MVKFSHFLCWEHKYERGGTKGGAEGEGTNPEYWLHPQKKGTSDFIRIKNQPHTTSGSEDSIFQSENVIFWVKVTKGGAKSDPLGSKKSLIFGTKSSKLKQIDFMF